MFSRIGWLGFLSTKRKDMRKIYDWPVKNDHPLAILFNGFFAGLLVGLLIMIIIEAVT